MDTDGPQPPHPPARTLQPGPGADGHESPGGKRRPGRWVLPLLVVAVATAAAATGLLVTLALARDPETRTLRGDGVAFSYPGSWSRLTGVRFASSAGDELSREVVGIDERNLVMVARYRVPVEVTRENFGELREDIARAVEALVGGAGGDVRQGPRERSVGGMPGLEFRITSRSHDGAPLSGRLVVAFEGTVEYFLNCRYTPEHAGEIERGCEQILGTLQPGSAEVGVAEA